MSGQHHLQPLGTEDTLCVQQGAQWCQLQTDVLAPLRLAAQHALDLLQRGEQEELSIEAKQAAQCVLANVDWLLE